MTTPVNVEITSEMADMDLINKLSFCDPKFIPTKNDKFTEVGLNIAKLGDCDSHQTGSYWLPASYFSLFISDPAVLPKIENSRSKKQIQQASHKFLDEVTGNIQD